MTHARHLKATADPADLRAKRVREAFAWARPRIPLDQHAILAQVQAECLEALEEAEVERERAERRRATG